MVNGPLGSPAGFLCRMKKIHRTDRTLSSTANATSSFAGMLKTSLTKTYPSSVTLKALAPGSSAEASLCELLPPPRRQKSLPAASFVNLTFRPDHYTKPVKSNATAGELADL